MREKPKIPWYHWPWWMFLLTVGLFLFYVVLTPLWMGIRAVVWMAERGASTLERRPRGRM